jgi:hypothetical protein
VSSLCEAVRDMVSWGDLSDDDAAMVASLLGTLRNGSFGLLLDDDSDP